MKLLSRVGIVFVLAGTLVFLFLSTSTPAQGSDNPDKYLPQSYDLSLSIEGPSVVSIDELVTYTVNFTVTSTPYGDIWGIEYDIPGGFTVVSTDPVTSTQLGKGLLRWQAADLSDHSAITITGHHDLATGGNAVHRAAFYDVYNPDLFSDEKEVTVSGITFIYLPLVLSN
jgi:hypothetical protein